MLDKVEVHFDEVFSIVSRTKLLLHHAHHKSATFRVVHDIEADIIRCPAKGIFSTFAVEASKTSLLTDTLSVIDESLE